MFDSAVVHISLRPSLSILRTSHEQIALQVKDM